MMRLAGVAVFTMAVAIESSVLIYRVREMVC